MTRKSGIAVLALLVAAASAASPGMATRAVAGQPLETLAYTHGPTGGPTTINAMRSDGSGDRQLIRQPRPRRHGHCGPKVFDTGPAWSPDGRRIAWDRYGCALGRKSGVWIARADGSGGHRIVYGFGPDWSPDGKRLAITRPTGRGTSGVFVVNSDGSGLRLVANEAGGASWSPDGKTLVMTSFASDAGGRIAYVSPDGSNREETGIAGGGADWSPDGHSIVFGGGSVTTEGGSVRTEIDVLDFDSGEIQRLIANRFPDSGPSWSPDGSQMAWGEQRRIAGHLHRSIYVMNADGSDAHRLRDGIDPDWRP